MEGLATMTTSMSKSRSRRRDRATRQAFTSFLAIASLATSAAFSQEYAIRGTCESRLRPGKEAAKRFVEGLKGDELLILMRHAEAIEGPGSPILLPNHECEKYEAGASRWVTEKGEAQLGKIAIALNRLKPNTLAIYSSPSCRAEQSARSLDRGGTLKQDLSLGERDPGSLKKLLEDKPRNQNLLFVTHSKNIFYLTGVRAGSNQGDAKAVAIDMVGSSGEMRQLSCLGFLLPEDWQALVAE